MLAIGFGILRFLLRKNRGQQKKYSAVAARWKNANESKIDSNWHAPPCSILFRTYGETSRLT